MSSCVCVSEIRGPQRLYCASPATGNGPDSGLFLVVQVPTVAEGGNPGRLHSVTPQDQRSPTDTHQFPGAISLNPISCWKPGSHGKTRDDIWRRGVNLAM